MVLVKHPYLDSLLEYPYLFCLIISKCLLQVEDDLKQGVAGAVPIPPGDAGKEEVIAALVANVDAMIKADRKITALKQLQVSKI